MPYVLPLTSAEATDAARAGGKGAMLATLLQAGLPVPPGCVLTSQALNVFFGAHLQAATMEVICRALREVPIPSDLQDTLKHILTQIGAAPSGWAVRSSAIAEDRATALFAGVYDSFLPVKEDDLWSAIRSCWLSWYADRALSYRQRLGDTTEVPAMAVVIQHVVPAQHAGVAFTVDLIRDDPARMVIQAAPGLGISVVSGVVEPEQYILSKTPDIELLETRLLRPDQPPLLNRDVIRALGQHLKHIEALCRAPQDIEWAWDGSHIWIVQSRPITMLQGATSLEGLDVWTNANMKDVIPGLVSPLSWSMFRPQLEEAIRAQYVRCRYIWPQERRVLRRFWGRAYFNMSLFQQASYETFGANPTDVIEQLGGATVQGFTPATAPSRYQRWRWLWTTLRTVLFLNRVRKQAPDDFARVRQYCRNAWQDVPHLDRKALADLLTTREAIDLPFLLIHLDLTAGMNGHFTLLRQLVARYIPDAPGGLFADLVTGLGDVYSAEHSYALWNLSRLARRCHHVMSFLSSRDWHTWQEALVSTDFAVSWQEFLDTYGHRGLYEVDVANPRWREQPDYLFEVLAAYVAMDADTPPFDPTEQTRRRQQAETTARQHLPIWCRTWFRVILRQAQTFSRLREQSKSHLVRLIDLGRQHALRAGDLLVRDGLLDERDAVFFLHRDELSQALQGEAEPQGLRQRIEQRRLERQRHSMLQPPDAIIGERPFYTASQTQHGTQLSGLPSNPGRVTATARVLRTPQEGSRLQAGDILVAPSTEPGWTPLFLLASGLVTETGGYLSHGAIVAREYGIPAVLNVPQATQRIPDGATVTLDGGAGSVQIVDSN